MFWGIVLFVMLAARMSAIGGPKAAAGVYAACILVLTMLGSGPIALKLLLVVLTAGLGFGAFLLLDKLGDSIMVGLGGGLVLGFVVALVPAVVSAKLMGGPSRGAGGAATGAFPLAYTVPAGYQVRGAGDLVLLSPPEGREGSITLTYRPKASYDKSLADDKAFANTPTMSLAYVSAHGLEAYELVQDHPVALTGQRYIKQPQGLVHIRYGWTKGPNDAANRRDVDTLLASLRPRRR